MSTTRVTLPEIAVCHSNHHKNQRGSERNTALFHRNMVETLYLPLVQLKAAQASLMNFNQPQGINLPE